MNNPKVSISLSQPLYEFVRAYQKEQQCSSRSEVIAIALQMLQQSMLEAYYEEANEEIDDAFDVTVSDGLDDETW